MARVVRPRRQVLNPDQIPLIVPDSDWTAPTELPDLRGVTEFAIDTEERDDGLGGGRGPGWAFGAGYVAGASLAWRERGQVRSLYVPIRHPDTDCAQKEKVGRWLNDLINRQKKRAIFFNAGFDLGWMKTDLGVDVKPLVDDASAAAVLVDENREDNGLDSTAAWLGIPGKNKKKLEEVATIYGVSAKDAVKNLWRFPARYVAEYAEADAVATLLAMEKLRERMAAEQLETAYHNEMRLVPLVHEMRRRGIRVNSERCIALMDNLRQRGDRALAALGDRLGMRRAATLDDIRSSAWLIRTFSEQGVKFDHEMRDSGNETPSFKKNWMRRGNVDRDGKPHWLPLLIAEAKQCHETADKFVQKYLLDFLHRGRIHASINQFRSEDGGTRSHRFSYSNPPLQQAPSRPDIIDEWKLTGEIAAEYRACFEPEPGELWFSPDYSQQEYRHIVADAESINLDRASEAADKYRSDPKTDFHNLVVQLTGLMRRHAKDCNFAKAFGAGVPKFALMTGMTLEDATETMGTYDTEMPFVAQLGKRCMKLADSRGYIRLIDGARCHFDKWEAAYLTKEERSRGYSEMRPMTACTLEEAQERARDRNHPWYGKRIKRAFTHKAMNRRIQGSAARQMKMAMAQCWEEGLVPMLQMHDELSFSLPPTRAGKKQGERVEEIMRTVYQTSVPFLVDAEWGTTWGSAKYTFEEAKRRLGKKT